MAWRRWILVAAVATAGSCTRDNPLFGDEGANDDGTGTSGVASKGDQSDTATDSSQGSSQGPSDGDTTIPPSTEPDPDTTEGPVDDTGFPTDVGDTGLPSCAPVFDVPPFTLEVSPALPTGAGCVNDSVGLLINEQLDGSVFGSICVGCPCGATMAEYQFTFSGPLPATLPPCINVYRQRSMAGDGSCQLEAYTILSEDALVAAGSNVVDPEIPEPWNFSMGVNVPDDCVSECVPQAGRYPITSATTGDTVADNATELLVHGKRDYQVTNYGTGITTECEDIARWSAHVLN